MGEFLLTAWGALLSFAPFGLFTGIVLDTLLAGRRETRASYWNDWEWSLPTPVPEHVFDELPARKGRDRAQG